MNKEKEPIDFSVIRVSDKKVRIKYKIPTFYKEGLKEIFLGYHNIGITIREEADSLKKSITYQEWGIHLKKSTLFKCFRPFEKYLNKISQYYGAKKKYIRLDYFPYYKIFEESDAFFIVPRYIYFEGKEVNGAIRKWKIQKILNNTEQEIENINNQ